MALRHDLTDRQRQILNLITETVSARGYPRRCARLVTR